MGFFSGRERACHEYWQTMMVGLFFQSLRFLSAHRLDKPAEFAFQKTCRYFFFDSYQPPPFTRFARVCVNPIMACSADRHEGCWVGVVLAGASGFVVKVTRLPPTTALAHLVLLHKKIFVPVVYSVAFLPACRR